MADTITDDLKAAYHLTSLKEKKQRESLKGLSSAAIVASAEKQAAIDLGGFAERAHAKNFAEYLSRHLATRFANGLRPAFEGILPDEAGKGQESRARTSKGYKKLDVNYSTPELGLGLGVSIKTINVRDRATKRYTKNYTRVDSELRAEAADYHERQPYSVMVAVIFLPADSCDDGSEREPSSFGAAVRKFRHRAGRIHPADSTMLFEGVFVAFYDTAGPDFGRVGFFDVMEAPPRRGRPRSALTFSQLMERIVAIYDARNNPPFSWAGGEADTGPTPISEDGDGEEEEGSA